MMYRRIAVFRALFLGDMLCAGPAFRALRSSFPGAEITLIGLPWARDFTHRFSAYIDRFVEFPGYPGINEVAVDPSRTQAFIAEQRAYGYDVALQMHGSGTTSAALVADLGARITAGYTPEELSSLLTYTQRYPMDQPEVLRNLNLARLVGARSNDCRLEFPLFQTDVDEARSVLAEAGIDPPSELIIGLHPGAKTPCRRWPPEYFAETGDRLALTHGARIVITGSTEELGLAQEVAGRMRSPATILCGRTSLGGLAALLACLDLIVTNSTGPAHLAEAVDTPAVILFGPTEYPRWAPMNQVRQRTVRRPVACSPCENWECPIDHRCLRNIRPSWVAPIAADLLESAATKPVRAPSIVKAGSAA